MSRNAPLACVLLGRGGREELAALPCPWATGGLPEAPRLLGCWSLFAGTLGPGVLPSALGLAPCCPRHGSEATGWAGSFDFRSRGPRVCAGLAAGCGDERACQAAVMVVGVTAASSPYTHGLRSTRRRSPGGAEAGGRAGGQDPFLGHVPQTPALGFGRRQGVSADQVPAYSGGWGPEAGLAGFPVWPAPPRPGSATV